MREPILVSLEYRSKLLADQGECAKEACCQKPDSCCKAECPKADSCCVKAECPAPAAVKPVYIILGVIAVVLGAIGVFVPGLPTTPLVLLASWCFYRSSPRMQAWLLNSFLGRYIRESTKRRGVSLRISVFISFFLWR